MKIHCPLCPKSNYYSSEKLQELNIHSTKIHNAKLNEQMDLICVDCDFELSSQGNDYLDFFNHRIVNHKEHIRDVLYPERQTDYLHDREDQGVFYSDPSDQSRKRPKRKLKSECEYCGILFPFSQEQVIHKFCNEIQSKLSEPAQQRLKVIRYFERYSLVPRFIGSNEIEILGMTNSFDTFDDYKLFLFATVDDYKDLDFKLRLKTVSKLEETVQSYVALMSDHSFGQSSIGFI